MNSINKFYSNEYDMGVKRVYGEVKWYIEEEGELSWEEDDYYGIFNGEIPNEPHLVNRVGTVEHPLRGIGRSCLDCSLDKIPDCHSYYIYKTTLIR